MKSALFTGSGVALVTPFTEDGVDFELLGRLIERQLEGGTDAIVVLGTTGEPETMTESECERVVRFAVERVNGRIPVIAGAGDNDTRRAADKCRRRQDAGADALLVVTPYYNKATQGGLIAHYERVADAAEVPVILYNVPSRTGVNMLPKTAAVLSRHEKVCALKEADASIAQLSEDVRLCGGFLKVYSGNDDLALPALAVGARGVISVTANVAPHLVKEMVACFLRGDHEAARAMHHRLSPLNQLLFSEVSPIPSKAALRLMGYGDGRLRLPLTDMLPENERMLSAELRKLQLIAD